MRKNIYKINHIEERHNMEEAKILKMIDNNPNIISTINNPTNEMKLLAVKKNGLGISSYKKSKYRNSRSSYKK
jgi:hypothetical protein